MAFGTAIGLRPVTAIVLSVTVFVLLDLSILAINYRFARQIDEDSLAINLAGRQRMLSQQMVKQVLERRLVAKHSERWEILGERFASSKQLFNDTLTAFLHEGYVLGSDGNSVKLRARRDPSVLPILLETQIIWSSYLQTLDQLEHSDTTDSVDLSNADRLLSTVNQLTTVLEHQARRKANGLRLFQSVAVVVVLLNFALILWQLRRRFQNVSNSNTMLRNLVEKMSTAVVLFGDSNQVRYANKAAGLLFACQTLELIGKDRDELLVHEGSLVLGIRNDGSRFSARVETNELVFEDTPVRVVTITDVSEHHESHAHWRHLAYHDALTGLPNRLLFEHRIKQELSAAYRHGEFLALLTIDLDNFKAINDHYGHLAGDEVLKFVAQVFIDKVRGEDLVARLGGDEFVIVLTRFKTELIAERTAQAICRILLQSLAEAIPTVFGDIKIHASIGASFYPIDGEGLNDIMRHSDASMYRAKTTGIGCELLMRA